MSKQKTPTSIKRIIDFQPTGQETAGKSPSFQAILKGDQKNKTRFQIKRSSNIKLLRRIAGYDPDASDILGEYIASKVMCKWLNTSQTPELAPKVSLVYNEKQNDFSLASQYLNDNNRDQYVGITLGELVEARGGKVRRDMPTFILNENANINQLPIGNQFNVRIKDKQHSITLNKKELYKATAASIILGDHDLNPDNFFMVFDNNNKKAHIGRIDLGHAFNDLIKKWVTGGHRPDIQAGRGYTLDALNRDELNGGKTKFLRYFGNGITLDRDFAEALRTQQSDMSDALESCKAELIQLIRTGKQVSKAVIDSALTLDKRMDMSLENKNIIKRLIKKFVKKVTNAAIALCARMGMPLTNQNKLTNQEVIEKLIKNCSTFIKNNQKEARSVANLIDIQVTIEDIMKKETITKEDRMKFASKVMRIYKEDQRYLKSKSFTDPIEWVRTNQQSKPFKGTLYDYIQHRAKEYGISTSRLNDFNAELKKANTILNAPEITKHVKNIHIISDYVETSHKRGSPITKQSTHKSRLQ